MDRMQLEIAVTDAPSPQALELIADGLGLKLVLVPVAWADWPLGLESGKYDAVLSNVTVTEERKKKFDFSSYRYDLLGIYTRTDGPIQKIEKPADVAGLKVVVSAGPTYEDLDQVRYLGNRSSGKMGFAVAASAARRGATCVRRRSRSGPRSMPGRSPSACRR